MPTPRRTPEFLPRPLRRFLETEVAGGVILLGAAATALAWANSPWRHAYQRLWSTELSVRLGGHALDLDLRAWVNEGLMALFFLVAALEIKRELVEGELRDRRRAMLPVAAALGGMVGSASVYGAFTAGGTGGRGWGVPMATDIALMLGVVALLGRRVSPQLKLFLLTLAIADDIGSIVVIAAFYTDGVTWLPLVLAAGLLGAVASLHRVGVHSTVLYTGLGVAVWLALHEGGISGTLAGVAMALLAPTTPVLHAEAVAASAGELADVSSPRAARTTIGIARRSISQMEWLEYALHPWSSYVVVPLFALANAGISVGPSPLRLALHSPVTGGVVVGRLVGKVVGVIGFAWLACRLRLAAPPRDVGWRDMLGGAALTGIGFAVSFLVADLALPHRLQDQAKLGVLVAAVVSAALAFVVLRRPQDPTTG